MTRDEKIALTKKIGSIVLNVLMYLFFFVCIIALVLTVGAKRDVDGAVSLFGRQYRVVLSDSMAACEATPVDGYDIGSIPVRSLITVELVPEDPAEAEAWYATVKKGDVLTFRYLYATQETITHRVVSDPVKKPTGGYIITLVGDNKDSDSGLLEQVIDTSQVATSPNYVIGRVIGQNYPLGVLVSAIKQPVGIICIVILPSLAILCYEIYRLYTALTEGKRKKEEEERQRRDAEYEELKRQLEILRAQQAEQEGDTQAPTGE